MKEIGILDIENVCIGQAEDLACATGCTAIICEKGMAAGIDVRGGGPAGRETRLADPLSAAQYVHGIVLAGGSAYGLDAGGGVMQYLEERGIGYEVGVTRVPLVCQSDIFDLTVGSMTARPDRAMGYAAAKAAMEGGNYRDGCFGAGCGASVGKLCGMERAMRSGIGSYAIQLDTLKIGAIVVVNALGDVLDRKTGKIVAGLLNEEKTGLSSSMEEMCRCIGTVENRFTGNTTLAVILTNAAFDKTRLCKLAAMGQNGLARSIRPVHTSADGDTVYAASVGSVNADLDIVGSLAADVVSEAILRAVESAEASFGLPAARDFS